MNQIDNFRGENEFLSNSYLCPLIVDGEFYRSVEHAFQASKTDDATEKEKIRDAFTAHDAKKLGKNVSLVQDWDQKKLDVMTSLVRQKFTTHLDLKCKLLMTGSKILIQGNSTYKDHFWGQDIDGVGENHLGIILMMIRDEIRITRGGAFQILTNMLQDRGLSDLAKKLEMLFSLAQEVDRSEVLIPNFDLAELKEVVDSLK